MKSARSGGGERSSEEKGLSLVELMMATVALVVALVSIVAACVHRAGVRREAGEARYAFAACRDTIEEIRSLPVSEVAALHGRGFDVPGRNSAAGALRPVPGDPDGLVGEIEVVLERQLAGESLYRVRTRVRWRGVSGPRTFELQTLLGSRE